MYLCVGHIYPGLMRAGGQMTPLLPLAGEQIWRVPHLTPKAPQGGLSPGGPSSALFDYVPGLTAFPPCVTPRFPYGCLLESLPSLYTPKSQVLGLLLGTQPKSLVALTAR